MKPIERLLKSDHPVKHVGIIPIAKVSAIRSLDEVEFKKELFSLVIPLYMTEERNRMNTLAEYWFCHSPKLFREVKEGELVPCYNVELDYLGDGSLVITNIEEEKLKQNG